MLRGAPAALAPEEICRVKVMFQLEGMKTVTQSNNVSNLCSHISISPYDQGLRNELHRAKVNPSTE